MTDYFSNKLSFFLALALLDDKNRGGGVESGGLNVLRLILNKYKLQNL